MISSCRRVLTYERRQTIGEPGLRAIVEVMPDPRGPLVWCVMDSNPRMQRLVLWLVPPGEDVPDKCRTHGHLVGDVYTPSGDNRGRLFATRNDGKGKR